MSGWSLFVPADACGGNCVVHGGCGVSPPGMLIGLVGSIYVLVACAPGFVVFGFDLNYCVSSFHSVVLFLGAVIGYCCPVLASIMSRISAAMVMRALLSVESTVHQCYYVPVAFSGFWIPSELTVDHGRVNIFGIPYL